jgi:hypothetical protein
MSKLARPTHPRVGVTAQPVFGDRLRRRLLILTAALGLGATVIAPLTRASDSGGQFLVQCGGPVRSAPDDPIMGGASHNHEFYGNRTINLASTYASLSAGATACQDPHDKASYWHPTLYVAGARAVLPKSTAYYTAHGKSRGSMSPWPAGLKIIAGDSHATAPQPTRIVYWGCGNGSSVSKVAYVPQCKSGDTGLTVHVLFPDCWDGLNLDSPDHKAHMAYSVSNECPATHPVSLPTLIMRWQWTNLTPAPGEVTLASCNGGTCDASGSPNTMHSDWVNAWDQPVLDALVAKCINGGIDCPAGTTVTTTSTPSVSTTSTPPGPTTTVPETTTLPKSTTTVLPTTTTTAACSDGPGRVATDREPHTPRRRS